MTVAAGGHLTHGSKPNQSGKWFKSVQYGVNKDDGIINYNELEELAIEYRPKLIIAGASAYSRHIDFEKIRLNANKVEAYLLADIAHYSGLIAAGEYPNPLKYAHVATTTTHKTLRGPRGGMILSNEPGYYLKNKYGIRIENLVYVDKVKNNLIFKNLTYVPILSLIHI